jgi:REP element-mobilizing transposase RayT
MKFDPQKHHRRSIRLPDHDYSQAGAYFITLVTQGRERLFGEVKSGEMVLTEAGQIVWGIWNALPARYPQIEVGTASVMPDHFHGIINIHETVASVVGAVHELPRRQKRVTDQMERRRMTLPLAVGYFKMNTAKRINLLRGLEGVPVWQRNYYEHIIRDDGEYNRIHLYIEANAANWDKDDENLTNLPAKS